MPERTDEATGRTRDAKRARDARYAYKNARNRSFEVGTRCIPLTTSADSFASKLQEHGLFAVCNNTRDFVLTQTVDNATEDRPAGLYVVDDSDAIVPYTGDANAEDAAAGDGRGDLNIIEDGGASRGAVHGEPFTPTDDVPETQAARSRRESDEVGLATAVKKLQKTAVTHENMVQENENLKKNCEDAKERYNELQAKYEKVNQEYETLWQQNRNLNKKYENAEHEISELRRENEEMKTFLKNGVQQFVQDGHWSVGPTRC